MNPKLKTRLETDGKIYRVDDDKHLATINKETGEVKYVNAVYAKGEYKEQITSLAALFQSGGNDAVPAPVDVPDYNEDEEPVDHADPRIPTQQPERDPSLGSFSVAHINYDHANLSDEDFSAKYSRSAACQLDFIARKPELFADRENLEKRLFGLC